MGKITIFPWTVKTCQNIKNYLMVGYKYREMKYGKANIYLVHYNLTH